MFGVREIPTIRTPHRNNRTVCAKVHIGIGDSRRASGYINQPHAKLGILKRNTFSVRTPRRHIRTTGLRQIDFARCAESVLGRYVKFVLATLVAKVRHRISVGRPHRRNFRRPAGRRQVAHVSLLGGNRKYFTTRFNCGAAARWRNRQRNCARGNVFPLRHHPRKITRRRNRNRFLFARRRIQLMHITRLLKHQRTTTRIERLHIKVAKLRNLRHHFRFAVVQPHVGNAVPIGNEVHIVAHPHRIHIF